MRAPQLDHCTSFPLTQVETLPPLSEPKPFCSCVVPFSGMAWTLKLRKKICTKQAMLHHWVDQADLVQLANQDAISWLLIIKRHMQRTPQLLVPSLSTPSPTNPLDQAWGPGRPSLHTTLPICFFFKLNIQQFSLGL